MSSPSSTSAQDAQGVTAPGGAQGGGATSIPGVVASSETTPSTPSVTYVAATSSAASTTSQSANIATAAPVASQSLGTPAKSSSSGGLSSGAVAGVAVAALILGALFAALATFWFMRSRSRKQNRNDEYFEKREHAKGADVAVAELARVPAAKDQWERHLPQSTDDNSVRLKVKTLLNQIELHVENFYTTPTSPVKITPEVQSQLSEVDSPHLPQAVAAMLPQIQDQTLLIKHCLAHIIISRTTDEGVNTESFLPPDFTALPRAIQMSKRNSRKPAFNQALSKWRVLTAYLRPAPTSDPMYLASRDSAIHAASSLFSAAFAPWANARHPAPARQQHLTEIMKTAAETGILVFSQPSTFAYLWNVPSSARLSGVRFVVTPGFAKVADEKAQTLEREYVMVPHVLHGV